MTTMCKWRPTMLRMVISSHSNSCSMQCIFRVTPHTRRHPVISKYWDASARYVTDGIDHVFDLLITFRPAQHDVIVKKTRNIFERFKMKAMGFNLLPQPFNISQFPSVIARNHGPATFGIHPGIRLEYNIGCTVLSRECK